MKPKVTLIHTADLHLGATFTGLGDKGSLQRRRLREAFADIVRLAIAERADALLLAGDTFDHIQPSPESRQAFLDGLAQLRAARIPALAIAGTHDGLEQNLFFQRLAAAPPDLFVLFTPQKTFWESPDGAVCVSGISLQTAAAPERPLQYLRRRPGTAYQVGLAHGAMDLGGDGQREARFTPAEIRETGLDYLALGHWHSTKDCSKGPVAAWYSGAPEMIAMDEVNSGWVLKVVLEESKPAALTPLRVGKRRALKLQAEAGPVEKIAAAVLAQADPDAVLELTLSGLTAPESVLDVAEVRTALEPHFFHVRIQDQTIPQIGPEQLAHYPETTVKGRFIRLVQAEIAHADGDRRRDLELALQIGLASLEGREALLWS